MFFLDDEVNVVYCSSDLFAEVCAVSIASLFENNRDMRAINVYVIDDKISTLNKKRITDIGKQYSRNVCFVEMPDPATFYKDDRFTIKSLGHTYARMILGDIIPENIERIISLDSDTLVLGSVDELWKCDMGINPIAGVDDCMGRVALVKTQHLQPDAIHCNAGMYLIDLKVWREEAWTQKFYEYIKSLFDKGISLGGYEEEVITKVVGPRMKILHPKYNLMTLEQVLSYEELIRFREPIKYYSREEINEALQNPVITHTTNFFYVRKRIFEKKSDHPMRKEYEKYRLLTPWKDEPTMEVKSTAKQRLFKNVWHFMPRKMALYVANFVRNEVRPRLKKKRDDE